MEGSSKKLIGEFLLELEENEGLRKSFVADPERTLREESGLDEEQQRIVREGTFEEIREAIRTEYGTSRIMLFPVWHFFTAEEGSDEEGSDTYEASRGEEAE